MDNNSNTIPKALTELSEIFMYTSNDIVSQIPKEILNSIESNKDNNYKFKYDITKDFEEQNLMELTKQILSGIYLAYCCNQQEKQELLKTLRKNELTKLKDTTKVCFHDLFKKKKSS